MVRGLPFARGHRSYGHHHGLWLLCRFGRRPGGGRDLLRHAPSTEPSAAERGSSLLLGTLRSRHKGFEGEENHRRWRECYGVRIIHPPKRNSTKRRWPKRLRRWVAGIRQIVETVYDKLFNTFGLWRERPHELSGLRARLAARVALHNFCASGSTISSDVPDWPLPTCWDGDLNSHQAFKGGERGRRRRPPWATDVWAPSSVMCITHIARSVNERW